MILASVAFSQYTLTSQTDDVLWH